MRSLGMFGGHHCVVPYADAGRPCADGSQCQGDCRAPPSIRLAPGEPARGVCQADSSDFGCNTSINGGKAEATLCID